MSEPDSFEAKVRIEVTELPSREVAEKLFALSGHTVADRLAIMDDNAKDAIVYLEMHEKEFPPGSKAGTQNSPNYRRKVIFQWAVRNLDLCSRTFHTPPPQGLVDLFAKLGGVPKAPLRKRAPKGLYEAARYQAHNPNAGVRAVAKAAGVSEMQVSKLRKLPEFQQILREEKLITNSYTR